MRSVRSTTYLRGCSFLTFALLFARTVVSGDLVVVQRPAAAARAAGTEDAAPCPDRSQIVPDGAQTGYIEPGSPWENAYCESFNARFRIELHNGEIFYTLKEAQNVIEQWRRHYITVRPDSALGRRPRLGPCRRSR